MLYPYPTGILPAALTSQLLHYLFGGSAEAAESNSAEVAAEPAAEATVEECSEMTAVSFCGMNPEGRLGDEISSRRVEATLDKFELTPLSLSEGRDYLDRMQTTIRGNLDGVVVRMQTQQFSDGLRYHSYLELAAVRPCDGNRDRAESFIDEQVEWPRRHLPERSAAHAFPERAYSGDINDDGLTDILVVLDNGAGLVFYQDS